MVRINEVKDRRNRWPRCTSLIMQLTTRRLPNPPGSGYAMVAVAALKPRLSTATINAATEVFWESYETRAEPTATSSTFAPGTDFIAVETLAAQPPQCIPLIDRYTVSMTDSS